MTRQKPVRPYTCADVREGVLCLDGRPVRTPAGSLLSTDCTPLAQALAEEWRAQGPVVDRHSMPLTQLLSTSIDLSAQDRADMERRLLLWIDTDLLCYRVDAPPGLASLQQTLRDPILRDFAQRTGQSLKTTTGLEALNQPEPIKQFLKPRMSQMDALEFTCFQAAVAASGSVVLALALTGGWIDSTRAQQAVEMEETYHAGLAREDLYGPDPERERASAALRRDLEAIQRLCGFRRESTAP